MSGVDKFNVTSMLGYVPSPPNNPWEPHWPNPADFPFNYYNLMKRTERFGLASVSGDAANQRIAIIGAGYAGLTVARELFRCGFKNVTIFEADTRIGGRAYPIMPKTKSGRPLQSITPFELGAMRIPLFTPEDGSKAGNSLTAYFLENYRQYFQEFPNPGSFVTTTGIYVNEGFGPEIDDLIFHGLLHWSPTETDILPPTRGLQEVYLAWRAWSHNVREWVVRAYGATATWREYWQKIVQAYEFRTFRDVALLPRKQFYQLGGTTAPEHKKANTAGDFGGLGLDPVQAEIFYTIGTGDGSWGAFFDVAALYPIRTLIFGFATQHKLLGHIPAEIAAALPLPASARRDGYCADSHGHRFEMPLLAGVSATPAMHLFERVSCSGPQNGTSLYENLSPFQADGLGLSLLTGTRVRYVDWFDGTYRLTTDAGASASYDHLVVTAPGWSLQMNTSFGTSFLEEVFVKSGEGNNFWPPMASWKGIKMSHNITSSKIFFKLKQRFWEVSDIPQVIVTDTFLRDVYGYALDTDAEGRPSDDPGVLLCSYTWEDDANKLAAENEHPDDTTLAARALARLDAVLQRSGLPKMSDFIDPAAQPIVWQWERQPLYRSCAKLYRAGSFDWNYAQLTWNQNHSRSKKLYFAGEFASLEGGWIEPAMIRAIDTVIHIVKNTAPADAWASVFNDYEMIERYPEIPNWRPQAPYAAHSPTATVRVPA